MAKAGRLYVPVDVNWYDEWGHAVSDDAALLWVVAISAAKRMNCDGSMTVGQLRRVAPESLVVDGERFEVALRELIDNPIAPISPRYRPDHPPMDSDTNGINFDVEFDGWSEWNDISDASKSGNFGNHVRWHVKTKKPSLTCEFCKPSPRYRPDHRPDIGSDIAPDSRSESPPDRKKSRVEKNKYSANDLEHDFQECWEHFPRKVARKSALSAYIAQRRKGADAKALLSATKNYALAMRLEEREMRMILMGQTFYGPNDRWHDYRETPKEHKPEPVARGAGGLPSHEIFANENPDIVKLPGEA